MNEDSYTESNLPKNVRIDEWIRLAEMNLDSSHTLINQNRTNNEVICHIASLSTEMYLKSCLIFLNILVSRTHDLVELNNYCKLINPNFKKLDDYCKFLTHYSKTSKYPSYNGDVSENISYLAVKYSDTCRNFVKNILVDFEKSFFEDVDLDIKIFNTFEKTNYIESRTVLENIYYDLNDKNNFEKVVKFLDTEKNYDLIYKETINKIENKAKEEEGEEM